MQPLLTFLPLNAISHTSTVLRESLIPKTKPKSKWEFVPREVYHLLLPYLRPSQLERLPLVSHFFKKLLPHHNALVWKTFCLAQFPTRVYQRASEREVDLNLSQIDYRALFSSTFLRHTQLFSITNQLPGVTSYLLFSEKVNFSHTCRLLPKEKRSNVSQLSVILEFFQLTTTFLTVSEKVNVLSTNTHFVSERPDLLLDEDFLMQVKDLLPLEKQVNKLLTVLEREERRREYVTGYRGQFFFGLSLTYPKLYGECTKLMSSEFMTRFWKYRKFIPIYHFSLFKKNDRENLLEEEFLLETFGKLVSKRFYKDQNIFSFAEEQGRIPFKKTDEEVLQFICSIEKMLDLRSGTHQPKQK